MTMTVAMLTAETLTEKNKRLRQTKCKHEEVFSSTCAGSAGTSTTAVCMDCGKTWRGKVRDPGHQRGTHHEEVSRYDFDARESGDGWRR